MCVSYSIYYGDLGSCVNSASQIEMHVVPLTVLVAILVAHCAVECLRYRELYRLREFFVLVKYYDSF